MKSEMKKMGAMCAMEEKKESPSDEKKESKMSREMFMALIKAKLKKKKSK